MKRFLILALCLCLLFPAALSESAYPACQGAVTDLANVLSESAALDLDILSQRYEESTSGRLYVITRHFLGGKDVRQYAAALFESWQLSSLDALLLVVIGEESYALQLGEDAQDALPEEMISAYFSDYFHSDFTARRYDQAISTLMLQSGRRIASAQGESLSAAGLFGQAEAVKTPADYVQDLNAMFSTPLTPEEIEEEDASILKEDESSGLSLWKILLIIVILRAIFGKKKKKRYNFGHHPHR